MRLLKRTASEIKVFGRSLETDALGGVCERFSGEARVLYGNIGFVNNTLNSTANALMSTAAGVRTVQTLRLRFIGRAEIYAGDGVMLPGEDGVCWRCVEVSFFPLITVARVECIAGADGL